MSTEQFRLTPNLPEDQQDHEGNEIIHDEAELPLGMESAILAEHMGKIQARLDNQLKTMQEAGIVQAKALDEIIPTGPASYSELCERAQGVKGFLDNVEEFIEPWRLLFYRPYMAVLERYKQLIEAPTTAFSNAKFRRLQFEREVKAAADRETARLQAEQKKREEEERLAAAVNAESLGMSEQAVETILTQPSIAPTPVAVPQISRPQGVRKLPPNWQAELVSQEEFWKWAKHQGQMPACLTIDMPTMNREAKTHKATLAQKYPGFRGVNKGGE